MICHGDRSEFNTFYSIDKFGIPPDVAEKRLRGKKSKASGKHMSNEISPTLQKNYLESTPLCYKSFSRQIVPVYQYACNNQK